MHNFSLVLHSVVTPRLVTQTLLGVNYFKQTFNDFDTSANPVALGLNTGVTSQTLLGAPNICINGFDCVGLTPPLGRIDTTGHITETMSYTSGKHTFRFGGEYRRADLDVFYQRNARGTFNFDGTQGPWAKDPQRFLQLEEPHGLPWRIRAFLVDTGRPDAGHLPHEFAVVLRPG
jgi:hypothetical protein